MSPRNAGEMESPSAVGRASLDGNAPYMTIYVKVEGNRITRATFQTFGCGYSVAACSVLTELLVGMALEDAAHFSASTILDRLDGVPVEKTFCANMATDALLDALVQIGSQI